MVQRFGGNQTIFQLPFEGLESTMLVGHWMAIKKNWLPANLGHLPGPNTISCIQGDQRQQKQAWAQS